MVLLFSCSGSNEPFVEEEEQVESPMATMLIFPENNSECQEGTIINEAQSSVLFQWNISEYTDTYEVYLENLDNGTQSILDSSTSELEIVIERGAAFSWSVVSNLI